MSAVRNHPAPLRRDREAGVIGGVCAGLGSRLGIDPLIFRLVFIAGSAAWGLGLVAYMLCWALIPAEGEARWTAPRVPGSRESWQVASGIALLMLSLLLLFREWGFWIGDALVWPVVLAAAGGALLWRESTSTPQPEPAAPGRRTARAGGTSTIGRAALGAALIIGGGLVFLYLNDALRPARDVLLAVVVVVVALTLILAPWWIRLARGFAEERAERIRSQERAELAAHLHDSVLQTLALMQRRSEEPRVVASLARRQERELRAWLNGTRAPGERHSLASALQVAASEVEEAHGVPIDVVAVGDWPLDPHAEAVVAAAREALVNAAKFAGDSPISVYAEADDERVQVFVRDRGPGFDPDAVPGDRRGVRESIVGRMQRHGGEAVLHTGAGLGTEVELTMERRT